VKNFFSKALFTSGCAGLLLLLLVSSVMAEQNLTVYKNESTILTLKEQFSEYALGNDTIADLVVRRNDADGSEIVINGIQEGTTNLIFWGKGGKISVSYDILVKARDLGQMLGDIRKLISGIGGISADIVGEKIIVKGEAHTTQDMKKVAALLEKKPHILNTVTLGPAALKVLANVINEFVGGEGQVKVKPVGQTLVLYGTSYGEGSAKRVEQFATIFYSEVVNLIKEKKVDLDPGADKMIQVHAHFIEVNTKAVEAMGASWTPFGSLDANGNVGEKTTDGSRSKSSVWQLSGFFTNLLPKFQNARERSMGRQLKVSSVSVKSGEKAEFQSGGEVGYPVVSGNGAASLAFKKYGMQLDVLPIAQGDKITLKIKIKINLPTNLGAASGAASSTGYINFTNSEVETVQYCSAGDSIALSGLLGQIDRKVFDASPDSSGALFELFHSKDFEQEKSELVIFITPEILGQAKEANMEIKQKVLDSFEAYDPVSR
jgi:pilus assembly protein CpaC